MKKLTGWVARAALVVSAMVVSAGASAQVTWSVSDGKVTGAQNVFVDGQTYDVYFGINLHVPIPAFMDETFAFLAGQALIDQVFVPTAPLDLDSHPERISDCQYTGMYGCDVFIVYEHTFLPDFHGYYHSQVVVAQNKYNGVEDTLFHFERTSPLGYIEYVGGYDHMTMSSWVTHVPEPETYALMLAGLGVIGTIARRRKTKQA